VNYTSPSASSSKRAPLKVFLAFPNYKGAAGAFVMSVVGLDRALTKVAAALHPWSIENESNIDRARAKAVAAFLKTDASHLLMCDSDIGFTPSHILRMVEADKPVIGGVLCAKELDFDNILLTARANPDLRTEHCVGLGKHYLFSGAVVEDIPDLMQPTQIERIGTGLMLIRRDVIERLWALHGAELGYTDEVHGYLVDLFQKYIDRLSGKQVGTDYSFCDRVRAAGFSVWLAPWAATTHRGEYTFKADFMDLV